MIVNVGITSVNGNASSTNDTTPAILPALPLYNLVIIYADNGAHAMSESSAIKGTEYDNIPMASKIIPKIKFRVLLAFKCADS